jgi:hypothetical protein
MYAIAVNLYMMIFYSLIIFPIPIMLLGYSLLSLLERGLPQQPIKALGRALLWLLPPYLCAAGIMGLNAIALSHVPDGSRSPGEVVQHIVHQSIVLSCIQLTLIGLAIYQLRRSFHVAIGVLLFSLWLSICGFIPVWLVTETAFD